jgi:microcystin-dependent protein
MWPTSIAPLYYLSCDGSEKLIVDYPELAGVLGEIYGVASDASLFKLPDFRSRTAVGMGQGPGGLTDRVIGIRGGEETNVLTAATMPPHSHTITIFDPTHSHTITIYDGSHSHLMDHWHPIPGNQFWHSHTVGDPTHWHYMQNSQPINYGDAGLIAGPYQQLYTLNAGGYRYWEGWTQYAGAGIVVNGVYCPAGSTTWASSASADWNRTGTTTANITAQAGGKATSISATSASVGGGEAHNNMPPFIVQNYVIKALGGQSELQILRNEIMELKKLLL